uniref:Uncharacterized protein n=1 Tax=Plectus sambesii TaxID=2011161 RepID=A0A914WMB8_9BILA
MLRLLIVLTALAVVALAQIGANTPCVYPYLEKGAYKTGKTACRNATTDCADTVAVCMQNYMVRRGPRLCCKQKATLVVPTCPAATPTLLSPNKNKALKAWMMCNPARKTSSKRLCPNGYTCAQATNEFTKMANSTLKHVCCK